MGQAVLQGGPRVLLQAGTVHGLQKEAGEIEMLEVGRIGLDGREVEGAAGEASGQVHLALCSTN